MTRKQLIRLITSAGAAVYGEREAASVARLVAEQMYGLSAADMALGPDAEISAGAELETVLREIGECRPVQYILGKAWFCGMEFYVNEAVLIPRPETEELAGWIVSEALPDTAILDIGTGSGAIAIELARRIAGSRVDALDISGDALRVARENARRYGTGVRFFEGNITADALPEGLSAVYDIIVSNPPYIPESERNAMHRNVTGYEPRAALFVPDDDPLLFYRMIADKGAGLLADNGMIYLEIHENMGREVEKLLAEYGYTDIEVRRDINGRERMARCTKS